MGTNKTWNGIETFEWFGYEWIRRPLWGTNHPQKSFTYLDENMVTLDKDNNIVLDYRYNPKELPMEDGSVVSKPYGRGFCRSVQEFKYGTFEWEMRCPYGKYQWPALWMGSDSEWPPEIDCMEGWSEECPKYIKRVLFRSIHPTAHWSKNGEHIQQGKYNNWFWYLKCGDNFDKYKVIWTPACVKIYYNNNLVVTYKDKDMLEHFNRPDIKMHVIMSTSPYRPFSEKDYKQYLKDNKPMLVKSFKYTPLK